MSREYDELYWKDRGTLENKHYWQVLSWLHFLEGEKGLEIKTALDYGCGRGEYVHALQSFGVNASGYEISDEAVQQSFGLSRGFTSTILPTSSFDFCLCYDVLEHCSEEEIRRVISAIRERTTYYALFSICMAGDPNFERDSTHVTKRTRAWWEEQVKQAGFKIVEVPVYFPWRNQLILAEAVK